jgi:hypothetical protein
MDREQRYKKLCETEWDYDKNINTPDMYSCGSRAKVWWKCPNDLCGCHNWEAQIYSRTAENQTGCPYCSNKRTCTHNNLLISRPKLCEEWDYTKNDKGPELYVNGSNKKVWWKCKKDPCGCHNWFVSPRNRTDSNTGCPYCSNKKLCPHNNLLFLYPKICEEWDYDKNEIPPNLFPPGSHIKVQWKCISNPCGCHNWGASICDRTGPRRTGCPFCFNNQVCDHNNLLVLYPKLCEEWDYDKNKRHPSTFSYGSQEKAWWKCPYDPCGCHNWEASICDRTNDITPSKCPYCRNRLLCDHNNLLVLCPKLCEEWDYDANSELPESFSPRARKKVWWKCKKGHKWAASIGSRNKGFGCGCPYCCRIKVSKKQIMWLEQITASYDIDIQSDANIGEYKVPIFNKGYYSLDGYIEYKSQKYAFEFDGCFWHGCPNCHNPYDVNVVVNKTFKFLQRRTINKHKFLQRMGYVVIVIKECEYDSTVYDGDETLDKHFALTL